MSPICDPSEIWKSAGQTYSNMPSAPCGSREAVYEALFIELARVRFPLFSGVFEVAAK